MYKFCTHCGAKMPVENAFCTKCGAKFAQTTPPPQPTKPVNPKIDVAASSQQYVPPRQSATNTNYNTQNQSQAQYFNQANSNNMQIAEQEFTIGLQYMDANNPQHNYIQAINHLQKAATFGKQDAKVYMAMAYLYQAMDIFKQNMPILNKTPAYTNNVNPGFMSQNNMAMPNSANPQFTPNPNYSTNQPYNNTNNNQNNNSSLKNMGKYAAAAAVGAVAGSMLHSASTASAAPHADTSSNFVPNVDTPQFDTSTVDPSQYIDPYTNVADSYIQTPEEFVNNVVDPLSTASEQITPADNSDDGTDHSSGNDTVIDPNQNADEQIESAPEPDDSSSINDDNSSSDDTSSFDSDDSSDSDGGSFFDDLFDNM